MSRTLQTDTNVVAMQLEALQRECRTYCARVSMLSNDTSRNAEVQGYLRLIDNINAACLRLAHGTEKDRRTHDLTALAA